MSIPAHINSTYKHPPAQGDIVGAGGGVNSAKAATTSSETQRTEMRADHIHSITYGHRDRENCGTMGDRSQVGIAVRFDLGNSGVRDSGSLGSRGLENSSGVCDSGSMGSRVDELGIAGKTL